MYNFSGLKMLVVDDEELLREILVETFAMYGADVDAAEGGNKAFEKVCQKKYDVIISDVRMPNGDGISLLSNIKQMPEPHPMKLFVCSAYNDLTEEKIRELNIVKIITKPFDIEQLLQTVSNSI